MKKVSYRFLFYVRFWVAVLLMTLILDHLPDIIRFFAKFF